MIVVTLLKLVLDGDLLAAIVFSDKIYTEGTCRPLLDKKQQSIS
jgi:hypothetical protein